MARIYEIKHRQGHIPLAVCVADAADVERYGECAHLPQGLLDDLLPGPVTVLLKRREDAPLCASLNPGVPTVGEHSHWQSNPGTSDCFIGLGKGHHGRPMICLSSFWPMAAGQFTLEGMH